MPIAPELPRSRQRTPEADTNDGLGWTTGVAVTACGLTLGLRSNSAEGLEILKARLLEEWEPAKERDCDLLFSLKTAVRKPGVAAYHMLYSHWTRIARSKELKTVRETYDLQVHVELGLNVPDSVFVHAGVVEWGGKAILLPGASHAGKSTLVRPLTEAGAGYYSDEFARLDSEGKVLAYPVPLMLRDRTGAISRTSPAQLGYRAPALPLPVGVILLTEYRRDGSWSPESVTGGQAALALFSCTVCASTRPEQAMDAVSRAVAGAAAWRGIRGEADEVVDWLRNL